MDSIESKKIRGGETSRKLKQTLDSKALQRALEEERDAKTVRTTEEERDGKKIRTTEEERDGKTVRTTEEKGNGKSVTTVEEIQNGKIVLTVVTTERKEGSKTIRTIEKIQDGKKSVTIETEEGKKKLTEKLSGLGEINVLMARNGSGKTRLLERFYNHLTPGKRFYKKPETGAYGGYDISRDPERMSGKDKKRAEERREHHLQGKGVKNINADADFKLQSFMRLNSLVKNEYMRLCKKDLRSMAEILERPKIKDSNPVRESEKAEAYVQKKLLKRFNIFPSGKFCYKEPAEHGELGLRFRPKKTGNSISIEGISSGESACIALMAGIYDFCLSLEDREAESWLLLDEPDTHLHPDLLHALVNRFLLPLLGEYPGLRMLIAAHSTPLLGALNADPRARVAFINPRYAAATHASAATRVDTTGASQAADQTQQVVAPEIVFQSISEEYQKLLPIFGAHPLTSVYAQNPVCILEGEDDELLWGQALRTAQGSLKLHPCIASREFGKGGQSNIQRYENKASAILSSVYDNDEESSDEESSDEEFGKEPPERPRRAIAYSICDLDDKKDKREALLVSARDRFKKTGVKRLILNCRAIENLMLTDEVLAYLGLSWLEVIAPVNSDSDSPLNAVSGGAPNSEHKHNLNDWIKKNPSRPNIRIMESFKEGGKFSRKVHFNMDSETGKVKEAPKNYKTWEGPYDRRHFDLKEIRKDIMSVLHRDKYWETCVGYVIGTLAFAVEKYREYRKPENSSERRKDLKKEIKRALYDRNAKRIWLSDFRKSSGSILDYLGDEIVNEFKLDYRDQGFLALLNELHNECKQSNEPTGAAHAKQGFFKSPAHQAASDSTEAPEAAASGAKPLAFLGASGGGGS